MSKDLKLSISERVQVAKLFDEMAKSTNLETLGLLLDEMKKVTVTPEEWAAAKLVKTPNADGTERWNWTDEGSEKDVTLQDKTVELLKAKIKSKSDSNEFSLADAAVISLNGKLY